MKIKKNELRAQVIFRMTYETREFYDVKGNSLSEYDEESKIHPCVSIKKSAPPSRLVFFEGRMPLFQAFPEPVISDQWIFIMAKKNIRYPP